MKAFYSNAPNLADGLDLQEETWEDRFYRPSDAQPLKILNFPHSTKLALMFKQGQALVIDPAQPLTKIYQ